MKQTNTDRHRTIAGTRGLVAGALAVLAGTCIAAAEPDSQSSWQFYTPKPDTEGASTTRQITVIKDGVQSTVIFEGGNITGVTHNGEAIDPSRVTFQDGVVTIRDENGAVIATLESMPGFAESAAARHRGDIDAFGDRDRTGEHVAPRSMIGISMAQPDESLVRHFGLEGQEVILIGGAYPGMPAHAAGLRAFDIVTGIDGVPGASPESLQRALSDVGPGGSITLDVIHNGQRVQRRVEVLAYDREALREAERRFRENNPDVAGAFWRGPDRDDVLDGLIPRRYRALLPGGGSDERHILIQPGTDEPGGVYMRALEEFRELTRDGGHEQIQERLREQMNDAQERLQDAMRRHIELMQEHMSRFEQEHRRGIEDRIESLEDQIRRRMDEVIERLEKQDKDEPAERGAATQSGYTLS